MWPQTPKAQTLNRSSGLLQHRESPCGSAEAHHLLPTGPCGSGFRLVRGLRVSRYELRGSHLCVEAGYPDPREHLESRSPNLGPHALYGTL